VHRISSVTSMFFSELVPWRLCGLGNHFLDGSMLQRISLVMRLCGVGNQFANEFVLQHISSLMSLCFSESVR
jgi:hypothetical protein